MSRQVPSRKGASGADAGKLSVVPIEELPPSRVLDLMRHSLGPGAFGRDEAIWKWKHRHSPFGSSPGLAAVAPGGELVGLRLFLPWRWIAGDRTLRAVRAVDTATAPGWRRRGVFRRLTEELVERLRSEGCDLIFNTPNPASGAGYLRMGWTAVGRVPLWVRPLRPLRLLAPWLGRGDETGAEPSTSSPPPPPPPTRPVSELLADPRLPDLLGALWPAERRLHTRRDADYLSWRYQPPERGPRYGVLWRIDGSTGAAIIARSRRRGRWREVLLCEVLATPGADGRRAAAELIDKIAAGSGADYLAACGPPQTAERAALRRTGFLPVGRRGPLLTVRPLSPAGEAAGAERWASWRSSIGDLELF